MPDKGFTGIRTACNKCGSSDNVAVYETEEGTYHGYCNSPDCGSHYNWETLEDIEEGKEGVTSIKTTQAQPSKTSKWGYTELTDRHISLDTAKKYQVKYSTEGEYAYPYYTAQGEIGWVKYRTPNKDFPTTKKLGLEFKEALLFGQQLFPAGSGEGKFKRRITITEGEFDAMAAYELLGSKGGVVSLKGGANSVKNALQNPNIYEYLNAFDTIVVCFDNDKQGRAAEKQFCSAFHPKKIKIFPHQPGFKDANDYLDKGLFKKFTDLWWKADPYKEDGIVAATNLVKSVSEKPPAICYKYPFEGLNEVTQGLRMGEMVTLTAMTGVGKTQLLREFTYGLLMGDEELLFPFNVPEGIAPEDIKIGILSIEEDPGVSLEGLGSLHMNMQLHLPDTVRNPDEVEKALNEIVLDKEGNCRLYFYDQFGSNEVDNIISKIWFMVKGLDCNVIILDHINMIVSDQRQEDERRALDEISTKLKQMTKDLKINLHVVAHQNREGKIRGTAAIEQLSNIVLFAERDLDAEDKVERNTTKLSVKKNRFSGRTGPAAWLNYNEETGRMEETDGLGEDL